MKIAEYTPQLGQEIARLYGAGHTIQEMCELNNWMPTPGTIYSWRHKHKDFEELMTGAEVARADALADETIHIADTTWDPRQAAVRVKARQWVASKLNRSKYGEKVEVAHTHTIDMGKLLAEAEARLVTSAAQPMPPPVDYIDVSPQPIETLEALLG